MGLAHALAKIISSRSKQANFQLITITHDEVRYRGKCKPFDCLPPVFVILPVATNAN